MANETFYSPITNLVSLQDIPDELGFVKDGITSLLDNILYKDLQYTRTPAGDSASYHLSIVSKKRIDFEIPGTGINLVLNPAHDATVTHSIFPVSVQYNWPVIGYVGSLDLSSLSFNPSSIFELALKIFRLSEKALIERAITIFLAGSSNPVEEFVKAINGLYGTKIPSPTSGNPVDELLAAIKNEPTIDGSAIAIFSLFILDNLDAGQTKDNLRKFFHGLVQPDVETYILNLLKPQFDASLKIGAGLEFPRDVLLPVDDAGKPLAEPQKAMMLFEPAEFYFSTTRGIGYEAALNVTLNHKVQIGKTGLGIELNNVKLDLSRTTNIAEADQDGRPVEFVGAYIQEAAITLPNFFNPDDANSTARLVAKNMIVGTGGFSGIVSLEAKSAGEAAPVIRANLGSGFVITLDSFAVSFKQNAIISSAIAGKLRIPGFKDANGNVAEVGIKIEITDGGNYSITLSEQQGIEALEIEDVLKLTVTSLGFGEKENKFFIAITGKIDFTADLPALGKVLPKAVEIKKIIIWQDGSMEFEGGGITLPKPVSLNAGPVKFTVTAIHYGKHKQSLGGVERSYSYFGFDGGISIKPGGVDARGDGIKYYYTSDNLSPSDSFLRIDGIGIDLTIPANVKPEKAAVLLKGYLSMKSPEPGTPAAESGGTEYSGSVSLSIPKVNLAGTASIRLNPDVPSFLVDVGIELSVPIMLGATGLGIYGFRGLLGNNYMPSKTAAGVPEENQWWEYYKSKIPAPPGKEGINIGKFAQEDGFSIGAGVSLATFNDSGKTFSSKLFFLLGLPEVLLLQGQAAVLKERISLDDTVDPPFSALIAITPQSVEAAFGVNYKLPDTGNFTGDILTLQATLEMGFFFTNAKGWYINLGRDTPEEKRVQAKVLKIFNGYSYLMLSASGMKVGAGAKWEFKKSYGPVGVELGAFIDYGGFINRKPLQMGGFIELGGFAHVYIFRFTLGFEITAGLSGEGPKPFIITGNFDLKFEIKLFWFLKLSYNINVEFTYEFVLGLQLEWLPIIGGAALNYVPAVASNIMSRETFAIGYNGATDNALPAPADMPGGLPFIPMDSFIDIEFLQPVKAGPGDSLKLIGYMHSAIATDYVVTVPPEKAKSDQVIHECSIESIKILHWNGTQWKNYYVYEAVSAINSLENLPGVTVEGADGVSLVIDDLKKLNAGYWQLQQPGRFDKLRILSQSMFSYQTNGVPNGISMDGLLIGTEDVFCPPVIKEACVHWDHPQYTGAVFAPGSTPSFNGIYLFCPSALRVNPAVNPFGFSQGMFATDDLHIRFIEPVAKVVLKLTTTTERVTIHYCNISWLMDENGIFVPVQEILDSKIIDAAQLTAPVIYDNLDRPVTKIIIENGPSKGLLNESPLHIGNDTQGKDHTYTGAIDELKIFNKVLSKEDVRLSAAGTQVMQGMVAGWTLNETATGINGQHTGIITPPISWVNGMHGRAAFFENKSFMAVPHHETLSFGETDFSIAAWVQVRRGSAQAKSTIVEKMDKFGNETFGYSLSVIDGKLVFELAFITVDQYSFNHIVADDQWKHISVTINRNSHRLCFYIDGELAHETALIMHPPKKGNTTLLSVCYTTYKDAEEYETQIGSINLPEEVEELEAGLTKRFQPIWRPNTKYTIQVETKDKITHGNTLANDSSYFHNFIFQTGSTLGHFHKDQPAYVTLKQQGKEDEYKLSKLQHYIDYDKSYPNADGRLIDAKPLFYKDAKLLLFFRNPYIYSMFSDWEAYQGLGKIESKLEAAVMDAEGKLIDQAPNWNFQPMEGGLSEDIVKINKLVINGNNCTSTSVIKPYGVQLFYEMPDLLPGKLYTAIYSSVYRADPMTGPQKSEVHKYVFQTSRYGSFAEQVESYGADPAKAVFNLPLAVSDADTDKAVEVLTDTLNAADPLISQYADKYDRLMQGALKLPATDAPVSTEFNIVKTMDGQMLGVLIRNPEPFNDPKLPGSKKQITVEATLNGEPLICVAAKEPSRIFISSANLAISAGTLEMMFNYFQYNGTDYILKDQRTVSITI